MADHKEIWLQPWCDDCESKSDGNRPDLGRLWAVDDPWTKCDECERPAVRYVLEADVTPEKPTASMILAGAKAMAVTSTANKPLTAVIYGQPKDVWRAMWTAWEARDDG